jgi:hypothetical protein
MRTDQLRDRELREGLMRTTIWLALLLLLFGSDSAGAQTATGRICSQAARVQVTTIADTLVIAGRGTAVITICDYEFSFGGTGNMFLETSTTPGACTAPTRVGMTWYGAANIGKAASNAYYRGLALPAGNSLCVNTSAAVPLDLTVYYDQN